MLLPKDLIKSPEMTRDMIIHLVGREKGDNMCREVGGEDSEERPICVFIKAE